MKKMLLLTVVIVIGVLTPLPTSLFAAASSPNTAATFTVATNPDEEYKTLPGWAQAVFSQEGIFSQQFTRLNTTNVLLPGAIKTVSLRDALSSAEGAKFVKDACIGAETVIEDLRPSLPRELFQAQSVTFCFNGFESRSRPLNPAPEHLRTTLLRHHLCPPSSHKKAYSAADLIAIKIAFPGEIVEVTKILPDDAAKAGRVGWHTVRHRQQIPQDVLDAGFGPNYMIEYFDGKGAFKTMSIEAAFRSDHWEEIYRAITKTPLYQFCDRSTMRRLLAWAQQQAKVQSRGRSIGEVAYDWLHFERPEEPNTWALYKLLGQGDGTRRPAKIPEVDVAALEAVPGLSAAGKKLLLNNRFRVMYHALGDNYMLSDFAQSKYWDFSDTLKLISQDRINRDRVGKIFHYLGNKPVTVRLTTLLDWEESPLKLLSASTYNLTSLEEAVVRHKRRPFLLMGGVAVATAAAFLIWLQVNRSQEACRRTFWDLYHAMREAWLPEKRLTSEKIEAVLKKLMMPAVPAMVNPWIFFSDKMDVLGSILSIKESVNPKTGVRTIKSFVLDFKKLPKELQPPFKKEVGAIFAVVKKWRNGW